jgi:hypothetical protein
LCVGGGGGAQRTVIEVVGVLCCFCKCTEGAAARGREEDVRHDACALTFTMCPLHRLTQWPVG